MEMMGFDVEVVNGHNVAELLDSFSRKTGNPRAIVAKTVKANGISFLENNKISHQCLLSRKKYEQAVEEIKKAYNGE